jgi:hypothetical protein
MALRCGRTRALDRDGEYHLSDRGTIRGPWDPAGLVDELNHIELLGDPDQRPDVTDPPRPDRARQSQVRHRRRIRRPQDGLPREGPLLRGIPQRLGSDAVPPPPNRALEDVHSFI